MKLTLCHLALFVAASINAYHVEVIPGDGIDYDGNELSASNSSSSDHELEVNPHSSSSSNSADEIHVHPYDEKALSPVHPVACVETAEDAAAADYYIHDAIYSHIYDEPVHPAACVETADEYIHEQYSGKPTPVMVAIYEAIPLADLEEPEMPVEDEVCQVPKEPESEGATPTAPGAPSLEKRMEPKPVCASIESEEANHSLADDLLEISDVYALLSEDPQATELPPAKARRLVTKRRPKRSSLRMRSTETSVKIVMPAMAPAKKRRAVEKRIAEERRAMLKLVKAVQAPQQGQLASALANTQQMLLSTQQQLMAVQQFNSQQQLAQANSNALINFVHGQIVALILAFMAVVLFSQALNKSN
jgi:hypothetical protein